MERLTNKNIYPFAGIKKEHLNLTNQQIVDMYFKLSQLEDIEEELGIDLITLFKIFTTKQLFTTIDFLFPHRRSQIFKIHNITLSNNKIGIEAHDYRGNSRELLFKDYGKTWSLRKEDLE